MAKYVGETIILQAQFTDDDGNKTTPGEPVKVTHAQDDGTVDVDGVTVTEDASTTGLYEHEYLIAKKGTNNYAFVSSDGAIEEDSYYAYSRKASTE